MTVRRRTHDLKENKMSAATRAELKALAEQGFDPAVTSERGFTRALRALRKANRLANEEKKLLDAEPDLALPSADSRYRAAADRVEENPDLELPSDDPRYRKAKAAYDALRSYQHARQVAIYKARDASAFKRYTGPDVGYNDWYDPDEITIPPDRLRQLDEANVLVLMESIKAVGLHTPITIRTQHDPNDYDADPVNVLVSGRHRLEACRRLGWDTVPTVPFDPAGELIDQADSLRLWEIAENLHRAELTVDERAAHFAEWKRLTGTDDPATQSSQTETIESKRADGRGHRKRSGTNEAARKLGIDRNEAHRLDKIASIAPEAARAAGINDHQGALLAVAKEPTPEAQLAAVQVQAERVNPASVNPLTFAKEVMNAVKAEGHGDILKACLAAARAGYTTARFFDAAGNEWHPDADAA
jgi:ParB-like chromosome segregation protein Spo0J